MECMCTILICNSSMHYGVHKYTRMFVCVLEFSMHVCNEFIWMGKLFLNVNACMYIHTYIYVQYMCSYKIHINVTCLELHLWKPSTKNWITWSKLNNRRRCKLHKLKVYNKIFFIWFPEHSFCWDNHINIHTYIT